MKINSTGMPAGNVTIDKSKTVKEESPFNVSDKLSGSTSGDSGLMKDLKNLSELSKKTSSSGETFVDMPKTIYFKTTQNDQYSLSDGFDGSRDIVAVGSHEGSPAEPYHFIVKFRDLQPNAEQGNLDTYVLLDMGKGTKTELPDGIKGKTEKPWQLAIAAYDSKNFNVYDDKGNALDKSIVKNLKYDSAKGTLEFDVDKGALRERGWQDLKGMDMQVFTTKDFVKQPADTIDRAPDKPWAKGGTMARQLNTNPYENPDKIEDWGGKDIYFVFTDRFSDGDTTNNINVDKKDLGKFHGGDLQGVIDKLDYIKDLGLSSIWLSPTMENQDFFVNENNAGYHYYWPVDMFKVDKHLGDMSKFEEMISKAHEKGIEVLLDIPLNHLAWEHPLKKEKPEWFHNIGDVKNWDDPYEAENGSIFGLPDLAQEKPEVYDYLLNAAKFWMDKGVDGFRLDAVKNIHFPFWSKFDQDVHKYATEKLGKPDFYLIGECFDGRVGKVNDYQREDMDGLFAYPEKFVTHEVIAHDGSMKKLAAVVDEGNKKYQSPELMGGFIDNHDTERFLSACGGNKDKFKLALDFLFTLNRIPTIYYGTEVGMDATPPPGQENVGWPATSRKDMEWGKDPDTLKHFTKLSSLRNGSEALKHGDFKEMWVDDKVYAYGRNHPLQEGIVVLNNGYDGQQRDIPLTPENRLIKDGTVLVDSLTGEKVTVQNGRIHVNLPAKGARIFFPEA